MSRFRVLKSKGRYYVVTTDSNGLAGGPYTTPAEAEQRVTALAAIEAAQAARLAQPEAHRMNITPGYRSPDVEDGRGAPAQMTDAAARLMPPGWVRWNTPDRQPLPPGWVPPWKVHRLPAEIDPEAAAMIAESAPPRVVDTGPPLPAVRPSPRAMPPWAPPARTLKP